MIKKVLLYTFFIGLSTVLIYGMTGSGAWFTNSAFLAGSVSSGNFEFKITGGPLHLDKIEPGAGYTSVGEFCVQNSGEYDMKFRGYMKGVEDPGNLASYLLLRLDMKPYNPTDENNYGPVIGTTLATDLPFTDLMAVNDLLAATPSDEDIPEPFAPGKKACYEVSARLAGDAGNDQLSKTLKADLYFDATQWINPGW
jgi:hypothetical protein